MLRRTFPTGSLLGVLIVAVSVSQATEGDTRPLSSQETSLLESLFSGSKAGLPISGFSGIADSLGPIRKTKEVSTFHIRIANAAGMKSWKREHALGEGPEQKVRKLPRHRPPFVLVEPSRDNMAVPKSILETPGNLESSNARGEFACKRPTILEQLMRGKREKKNISPLIFIIHRRLALNKTKNTNTTLSANQTKVAAESSKNETAESSRRRRELAINVIKKVILNKILSSSRLGMRPKPGKNYSDLGVTTAPGLLMPNLPLVVENINRDTGPNLPSFEFSYELQVVKYNDGEPRREPYPYGFAFTSGGQLPTEMTVFVMTMLVLPLPIIGLLLLLSRRLKMTANRKIIKNPSEATLTASGSRNMDVKLTICANTLRPAASQPGSYTTV